MARTSASRSRVAYQAAHSGPPTRSRWPASTRATRDRDRCRGRRVRDLAGSGEQRRARAPLHRRGRDVGNIDDLTPATNPSNQILWFLTLAISPSGRGNGRVGPSTPIRGIRRETSSSRSRRAPRAPTASWTPMVAALLERRAGAGREPATRRRRRRQRDARVVRVQDTSCGFLVCIHERVVLEATHPSERRLAGRADALRPTSSRTLPVVTTPAGEVTVAWIEHAAQVVKVVTRPVGGAFPPPATRRPSRRRTRRSTRDIIGSPSRRCEWRTARAGRSSPSPGRMERTLSPRPCSARQAARGRIRPRSRRRPCRHRARTSVSRTSPSLTMDGLGNAVATWTRGSVIQAAAFDALASCVHRSQRPRDRHDGPAGRGCPPHARHLVGARRGPAELELR